MHFLQRNCWNRFLRNSLAAGLHHKVTKLEIGVILPVTDSKILGVPKEFQTFD